MGKLGRIRHTWENVQLHQITNKDVRCAVKSNDYKTSWFDLNVGLKHGCLLSTTMLYDYINDLNALFESNNKGISLDGKHITHHLYADDLVLIADSELNL